MIDRLINFVAITMGALLLCGACVTPLLPMLIAVMVGGSEVYSIRTTGLPACVRMLQWSEWRPNDGTIRFSEWAPPSEKLQQAQVVAYRTASAHGIVSQYTFYQGRYLKQDGTEAIAPASGPRILISPWGPGIAGAVCMQIVVGGLLLAWAGRRSKRMAWGQPSQEVVNYTESS